MESAARNAQPRLEVVEDESQSVEVPTTPMDVHGVGMQIMRANEIYRVNSCYQEKPTKWEVLSWFLYGLCSYFVFTVLVPIVFPLIISQIFNTKRVHEELNGWGLTSIGLPCKRSEILVYERIITQSIKFLGIHVSPLEWTSISWLLGLIVAAPILTFITIPLDYGRNQQAISAAAIAVGAVACLPSGFFRTASIFPLYITLIVVGSTVAAAAHTRQLSLMVRGFLGSPITKSQFPNRTAVSGWLSLYSTAAGCVGSTVICAFTFHMLRHSNGFLSLWIVSIFSGLIWVAGIAHTFASNRPGVPDPAPKSHPISIFRYPHAAGSLAFVFLSSFSTMCIFTGGILFFVGQLCFAPFKILSFWLTYFIFQLLSLPTIQPIQQVIRADAVKMQIMGFLLTAFTSGFGFYYHHKHWENKHVLVFAAVQTVAAGILHAYGRVLISDCSPEGKEGAFSAWFSWVRVTGAWAGFAVASTRNVGRVDRTFGIVFCVAVGGVLGLIFGNVSNYGGAVAAGIVREEEGEEGFPTDGVDMGGVEMKTAETMDHSV